MGFPKIDDDVRCFHLRYPGTEAVPVPVHVAVLPVCMYVHTYMYYLYRVQYGSVVITLYLTRMYTRRYMYRYLLIYKKI